MIDPARCSLQRWLIGLLALLVFSLANGPKSGADDGKSIRLLSDEAADACIKDVDCMRGLFVHAAFGDDQSADDRSRQLLKWSGPIQVASFVGGDAAEDVRAIVGETVRHMHRVATIAGSDLSPVDAKTRDVVNVVLLISDDFARDRDGVFSDLLTNVFAGRLALYDELASGMPPICRSHLFVEREASVAGGLALVESDVDAAALRRCLHHVVLNVLGFPHPLPDGVDSVLSPDSERQAWTAIDFLLLKMLNDSSVLPGMAKAELEAVFPQIYQEALGPQG